MCFELSNGQFNKNVVGTFTALTFIPFPYNKITCRQCFFLFFHFILCVITISPWIFILFPGYHPRSSLLIYLTSSSSFSSVP